MRLLFIVISIFVLIANGCTDANLRNSPATFNYIKARGIREEMTKIKKDKGDTLALRYIDSLAVIFTDYNYKYLLRCLRTRLDGKITDEERKTFFLNQLHSPEFYSLHDYNRFRTHAELSSVLVKLNDYHAAIEELFVAIQHLEPKQEIYKLDIANTYKVIGIISSLYLEEHKKTILSYSRALEIFEKDTVYSETEDCLYRLSVNWQHLKDYEKVKYYAHRGIAMNLLYAKDTQVLWAKYYSILASSYARLKQTDSLLLLYRQANDGLKNGSIKLEIYDDFINTNLKDFVELGLDTIVTYEMNRLYPTIAEKCENRYALSLKYTALAALAQKNGQIEQEREYLLRRLYYSSNCSNDNEYFIGERRKAIDRLIEIDEQLNNVAGLNEWYKKKLDFAQLDKAQNDAFVKQLDYWADKDLKYANQEIVHQKENAENQKNRLIIVTAFLIICLLLIIAIGKLYKKVKQNERILSERKAKLEVAHSELQKNNNELTLLYAQVASQNQTISEQNEQMAILVEKLKESNESLSYFAQVAAHDLKAPLRTITTFTGMLHQKYKSIINEKDDELFNFIMEGSNNLKRIIDGLLNFSSMSNVKNATATPMNLEDVLHSVIKNLTTTIEETNTKIITPSQKNINITAHKTLIEQLFLNLINNAIKFRKKDKPSIVTITCQDYDDNYWQVNLKDRGIGIDQVHHGEIFQIFRKLHSSSEYKGAGIGLATCKKIVENYGGIIWLESEPDIGTIFHFLLPKTKSIDNK
jgi:signal transduction histidine kinase